MDVLCGLAFSAIFFGVLCFVLIRFATRGFRGAALGAKVVSEQVSFRTESSGFLKIDVSVVRTAHRTAPIGLAIVVRAPTSIGASGASLTREQALFVARWLRDAAAGAERP